MGTGHYGNMMTQNYGQAPKWSKHDPKPEDDADAGWDDNPDGWDEDDEEIIESDDGDEEEDDVDYGDDDEG
jgi:hypothetical protein